MHMTLLSEHERYAADSASVDAIKIAPDGSILARMNDRWHIVSGVEGRD